MRKIYLATAILLRSTIQTLAALILCLIFSHKIYAQSFTQEDYNNIAKAVYEYNKKAMLEELQANAVVQIPNFVRISVKVLNYYNKYPEYGTWSFKAKLFFAKVKSFLLNNEGDEILRDYIAHEVQLGYLDLSANIQYMATVLYNNYDRGYPPVLTEDIRSLAKNRAKFLIDDLESTYHTTESRMKRLSSWLASRGADVSYFDSTEKAESNYIAYFTSKLPVEFLLGLSSKEQRELTKLQKYYNSASLVEEQTNLFAKLWGLPATTYFSERGKELFKIKSGILGIGNENYKTYLFRTKETENEMIQTGEAYKAILAREGKVA